MSTPTVPSDLQLHRSQRTHPAFRGEGRGGGIRESRRSGGFLEEPGVAGVGWGGRATRDQPPGPWICRPASTPTSRMRPLTVTWFLVAVFLTVVPLRGGIMRLESLAYGRYRQDLALWRRRLADRQGLCLGRGRLSGSGRYPRWGPGPAAGPPASARRTDCACAGRSALLSWE